MVWYKIISSLNVNGGILIFDKHLLSNGVTSELFDKNFNSEFNVSVLKCVTLGFKTFQQFKVANRDFWGTYSKGKGLDTQLLTFSVEKALYDSAFTPQAKHRAVTGEQNSFGYRGLYLRTEDFIVTLSKADKAMRLPKPSRSRQTLSAMNGNIASQLQFSTDGVIVDDDFKYAIITYGRDYNYELSHLSIVTPEPDYSNIIYDFSVDLLREGYVFKVPEQVVEEQITALKKEYEKKRDEG